MRRWGSRSSARRGCRSRSAPSSTRTRPADSSRPARSSPTAGGRWCASCAARTVRATGTSLDSCTPIFAPWPGGAIEVAEGREAATDTAVVWLPRRIAAFEDPPATSCSTSWRPRCSGGHRRRHLSGRIAARHPLFPGWSADSGLRWAGKPAWLVNFFGLFPDPELAQRLYHAAATLRAVGGSRTDLPGLAREAAPVLEDFFALRPVPASLGGREGFRVAAALDLGPARSGSRDRPRRARPARTAAPAGRDGRRRGPGRCGDYPLVAALPRAAALLTRCASRAGFGRRSPRSGAAPGGRRPARSSSRPFGSGRPCDGGRARSVPGGTGRARASEKPPAEDGARCAPGKTGGRAGADEAHPGFIRIGAQEVEIPEELQPLVEEIRRDLGEVPPATFRG